MDVKSILGSWRKRRGRAGGWRHALEFGSRGNEVTTPLSGFPKQCIQPTLVGSGHSATSYLLVYFAFFPLCEFFRSGPTLMHYSLGIHTRLREEFKRAGKQSTWCFLRQRHAKNLDKDVKRQWSYNQGTRGFQWLTYRNGQQNEAGYQWGWPDISACPWGLGANLCLSKAASSATQTE